MSRAHWPLVQYFLVVFHKDAIGYLIWPDYILYLSGKLHDIAGHCKLRVFSQPVRNLRLRVLRKQIVLYAWIVFKTLAHFVYIFRVDARRRVYDVI